MNRSRWLAAVVLATAPAAWAAEATFSNVTLTCDYMEYRSSESVVVARGNAVMVSSGTRVEADELTLHLPTRTVEAKGHLYLEDDSIHLLADEGRYDAKAGSGVFTNGFVSMPPWRLWARKVVRLSSTSYRMEHAAVSSCDEDPPHYHIRMSRLDLRPNVNATAVGARFVLDRDTIAGFPYYRKTFREKPWSLTVDPGHSSYHGFSAESIFTYRLTPSGTARVYWDHYERTGNGWGGEYTYFRPDVRGSIYGYRINDNVAGSVRWNARMAHWQSFTSRLSLQVNALAESDSHFNNLYFSDDLQRVRQTAQSNAALAYQHPAFTARSMVQQDQIYDPVRQSFVRLRTVLPELSFQTASLSVASSTFLSWGISLRNQYDRPMVLPLSATPLYPEKDRFRHTGDSSLSLRRRIPLSRTATLEPSAGVSESWQSWQDDGPFRDPHDVFQGRGFTGLNLRHRLSRSLDYDLAYGYRVRWSPNQFKRNHADPNDQGVEQNLFSLGMNARRRSLWARLTAGYDLRDRDGEMIETPRQKVTPPTLNLDYSPASWASFSFQESYLIYPAQRPQYTQGSFRFGARSRTQFTSGFSYNVGSPGALQLRHGASFNLTKGWRIDGDIRYLVEGDGRLRYNRLPKTLFERNVVVTRDLHCWNSRISLRQRPGVYEVFVRLDLKTNLAARRQLTSPEEKQYYPGRETDNP
jgi:lipopolysaccharide assembly outer membrane protein LptD (OstA)